MVNDKVYLTSDNDGVHARAPPTSLALRPDTTSMFPTVSELTAQATFAHIDNHPDLASTDQRMAIAPRRLADGFGVPLHPGGPVAVILTISHYGTGRPSRWRRIVPTRALDTISNSYLDDWIHR